MSQMNRRRYVAPRPARQSHTNRAGCLLMLAAVALFWTLVVIVAARLIP